MKKMLALVGLLAFLTPLSILAQTKHVCGVSPADDDIIFERMMENRARAPHFVMPRNTVYIPVWFHLAAAADGTGRVPEARVLDMLCEWNRLNEVNQTNMQFYIRGFNYINRDNVYNTPKAFSAEQFMIPQKKNNGMNVFLCRTADDGSSPNSITLAYYSPSNDWIVCANDQVSTANAGTMAHEAGHFFTLPHPFRGWDAAGFCPTAAASCAPRTVNSFGTVYPVEMVERTGATKNCETAGDGFCDTPADYNFNLAGNPTSCGYTVTGCRYAGIAKDPDCVPVDPDETLIMGYYLDCETKFTAQQKTAMLTDHSSARRAYLRNNNPTPSLTDLTPPTLLAPASGATTQFSDNVLLSWAATPNALGYIVDIAPISSFLGGFSIHVTTNALQLSKLIAPANFLFAGRTLHWRVRPYTAYKVCSTQNGNSVVSRSSFVLGNTTKVADIEGATNLTVSPNPVSQSESLNISLQSEKAFEGTVKIYNLAGQLLQNETRNFSTGFSQHTLSVGHLHSGLYILTVESATGVLKQRFTVQE